jgi:hypothetical protein
MRRTFAAFAFTAVLASGAASFTLLPGGPENAAPPKQASFLVPASDGYGVGDCLTSGSECGQVVADAWCETQGYTRAVSFGAAGPEDVTGGVQQVSLTSRQRPVSITCSH